MTNVTFKIIRTDKLDIRVSELCRLGYADDPNPTYEWEYVGQLRSSTKIGGKIASELTDEELLAHFENNKRMWGYR